MWGLGEAWFWARWRRGVSRGWETRTWANYLLIQKLLPGREIVEEVWRGARECLYGPKG